jgi:hypothetical protein
VQHRVPESAGRGAESDPLRNSHPRRTRGGNEREVHATDGSRMIPGSARAGGYGKGEKGHGERDEVVPVGGDGEGLRRPDRGPYLGRPRERQPEPKSRTSRPPFAQPFGAAPAAEKQGPGAPAEEGRVGEGALGPLDDACEAVPPGSGPLPRGGLGGTSLTARMSRVIGPRCDVGAPGTRRARGPRKGARHGPWFGAVRRVVPGPCGGGHRHIRGGSGGCYTPHATCGGARGARKPRNAHQPGQSGAARVVHAARRWSRFWSKSGKFGRLRVLHALSACANAREPGVREGPDGARSPGG